LDLLVAQLPDLPLHVVAKGPLKAIYERLSEIRAQLERLVLTHRWTLRESSFW
jgi:hypothetical protein